LDHAATDFVPVPQAVEGPEKEDVGDNAEAIGARATLGAWTSARKRFSPWSMRVQMAFLYPKKP
jgi:hypothetical protein